LSEKEYVILLGQGVRKRHFHQTTKGKIVYFVVQLEIICNDKWTPIIRYDCAHGISHVDKYNKKGEQLKEMLELPFNEALTYADEDINTNWENYKNKFLKGN